MSSTAITALTVTLAVLLLNQAAGTATFLALYLRVPGWRDTAVGRHLAWYAGTLLGLYVTTLLSFLVYAAWLIWLIFALHLLFGVVIWQRVLLVLRARRVSPLPPDRTGR